MSTTMPEAGEHPADVTVRARELGLADYQWEIYQTLLANPHNKIPREVLPVLARWLDRVDFGALLIGREEAAGIIGVNPRTIERHVIKFPQWMTPTVSPYGDDGVTPVIELWLRARVESFARWRQADEGLRDQDKERRDR